MAETNRGPTTLVITIVFLVLSSIFVTLRFISRAGIVRKVSIDDYVMLFAWVSTIAMYVYYEANIVRLSPSA